MSLMKKDKGNSHAPLSTYPPQKQDLGHGSTVGISQLNVSIDTDVEPLTPQVALQQWSL